jgi:GNAT superfamily N-acetyltransferase/broad-specificity NMP kinase
MKTTRLGFASHKTKRAPRTSATLPHVGSVVSVSETVLGDDGFASFVELFDRYRVHYGQPPDRDRSERWLIDATTSGPMRAFLARVDGAPAGICLIVICPASLALSEFWIVRDVYVDPQWRGKGVARALLDNVRAAAEARGALRLTLQTEDDNKAALRLYERYGFRPTTGLRHLSLPLRERAPAPNILVTGVSGTGKSSALAELSRRGYRVVDTDEPGWRTYRAYDAPGDELHRGEYLWAAEKMAAVLSADDDRSLFVGGRATNQSDFYDRFDAIVLLSAPVGVLLDRIAGRTSNPYGKTTLERAEILADVAEVEPLIRKNCTHELDASRPLQEVVAELAAIASNPDGRSGSRTTSPDSPRR